MLLNQKYILIVFIMLSIIYLAIANSQPQNRYYSKEIQTYKSFLDSCTNPDFGKLKLLDKPSVEEIKHVARIIYEAEQRDPISKRIAFDSVHQRWDDTYQAVKKAKRNSDSLFAWRPGFIQGTIIEKIGLILSRRIYAMVTAPYLLRIKILRVDGLSKSDPNDKSYIPPIPERIDVHAVIKEVLTGQSHYSAGDTIVFSYDFSSIVGDMYFQPEHDCLVSLFPLSNHSITLWIYLDYEIGRGCSDYCPCGSCGRYPIENGILIDRENTFGFGNEVKWTDFVGAIKKEINHIKSW